MGKHKFMSFPHNSVDIKLKRFTTPPPSLSPLLTKFSFKFSSLSFVGRLRAVLFPLRDSRAIIEKNTQASAKIACHEKT